jgi:hypothetical protein
MGTSSMLSVGASATLGGIVKLLEGLGSLLGMGGGSGGEGSEQMALVLMTFASA